MAEKFKIAIRNKVQKVRNAVDSSVLELYFLDELEKEEAYDWWTGEEIEINPVQDVIAQVRAYNSSTVKMIIDCIGGDPDVAIAIYNYLKNGNFKVEVDIIGMCMSAATILAQAASKGKRRMAANGFFVIHEASGTVRGTSKDVRQGADVIDRYSDQIASILATNNTKGKTADEIKAMWAGGDCWMTGQEAMDMGFIDSVYNADSSAVVNISNKYAKAITVYNNVPTGRKRQSAPETVVIESDEPDTDDEEVLGADAQNSTINKIVMEIKNKVSALLDGFKGTTVKNAATSISLHDVIAEPFTKLSETIETEVTNEIKLITDKHETSITELRNSYDASIADLKNMIEGLRKENENMLSDIRNIKGGESSNKGGAEPVKAIGKFTSGR